MGEKVGGREGEKERVTTPSNRANKHTHTFYLSKFKSENKHQEK